MRIFKKTVITILFLVLSMNFCSMDGIISKSVQASVSDINIISGTEITAENAKAWARSKGATETFVSIADLFWNYSASHGGVNPAVAYAQSAKETNFGRFGGVIDESYHNTCGLKISSGGDNYDPNAHKRFNSWDEGVQAQLDHLALYAGASGYPRANTFDTRHFASIKGRATTVVSLGGNWAPSGSYGSEIMVYYNQMLELAPSNPQPSQHQQQSISRGSSVTVPKQKSSNTTTITKIDTTPKIDSLTTIESPTENSEINGDVLNITGWAINQKQITKVNVYIDGQLKGTATYGQPRQDVATSYPNIQNASNSGFSVSVDIRFLPDGNRVIKIEQVANDGTTNAIERHVSFKHTYPVSNVIAPTSKVIIDKNSVTLKGWTLNVSTARKINVYVDGKLIGTTTEGYSRTECASTYKAISNANLVQLSDIRTIYNTNEKETIKKIKLAPKELSKIPDEININPLGNSSLLISRLAPNISAVKSAKMVIDGDYLTDAEIKLNNSDVVIGCSNYVNSNFKDVIGKHEIKIETINSDGTRTSETRAFVYGTII